MTWPDMPPRARGLCVVLLGIAAGCAGSSRGGKAMEYAARPEEVRFGAPALAGVLSLPASPGRLPAVVIVPGSGPATREFPLYAWLAERLSRRGFVVLRYDKRGAGGSEGDWSREDFQDRARDVLACVECLRGRPEVDPARIGLLGHSQGGWVAPLAASMSDRVAFVAILAGAAVTPARQDLSSQRHRVEGMGLPPEAVADAVAFVERCHAYARGSLADAELEALLQETKGKDWWTRIAPREVPVEELRRILKHLGRIIDHDPAVPLARLRCPLLALFGERDTYVDPSENLPPLRAALEAAKHPDFEIRVIPDATHTFSTVRSQGRDLSAEMLETLTKWLSRWEGKER